MLFAGNFAPLNWALCNGQTLSISQYQALFSILGTTYGGNGTTTFQLPDLRGRVPIHAGQGTGLSPYALGQFAGSESVALTVAQMPSHSHLVGCDSTPGKTNTPKGHIPAASLQTLQEKLYSTNAADSTMSPAMIGPSGQNLPVNILQPYLTLNFIIALNGIFPSRN